MRRCGGKNRPREIEIRNTLVKIGEMPICAFFPRGSHAVQTAAEVVKPSGDFREKPPPQPPQYFHLGCNDHGVPEIPSLEAAPGFVDSRLFTEAAHPPDGNRAGMIQAGHVTPGLDPAIVCLRKIRNGCQKDKRKRRILCQPPGKVCLFEESLFGKDKNRSRPCQ